MSMHEISELASAAWFEVRAKKHVKKTLARVLHDWRVSDADAIARQLRTKHVDLSTLKLKFSQKISTLTAFDLCILQQTSFSFSIF